jgi:hypothetical protein
MAENGRARVSQFPSLFSMANLYRVDADLNRLQRPAIDQLTQPSHEFPFFGIFRVFFRVLALPARFHLRRSV